MIDFAERRARDLGLPEVRLYTHVLMIENIALYTRLGYIETHRETEHGFTRAFFTKQVSGKWVALGADSDDARRRCTSRRRAEGPRRLAHVMLIPFRIGMSSACACGVTWSRGVVVLARAVGQSLRRVCELRDDTMTTQVDGVRESGFRAAARTPTTSYRASRRSQPRVTWACAAHREIPASRESRGPCPAATPDSRTHRPGSAGGM